MPVMPANVNVNGPCPYNCNNKTSSGYCATTVCIMPDSSQLLLYPNLEPVVYCRDCQDAEYRNDAYVEAGFCRYFCHRYFHGCNPDDYCSRGVRR